MQRRPRACRPPSAAIEDELRAAPAVAGSARNGPTDEWGDERERSAKPCPGRRKHLDSLATARGGPAIPATLSQHHVILLLSWLKGKRAGWGAEVLLRMRTSRALSRTSLQSLSLSLRDRERARSYMSRRKRSPSFTSLSITQLLSVD